MKKLLAVLLALLTLLTFTACGGDSDTESESDTGTDTTTDTESGTDTETDTDGESESESNTETDKPGTVFDDRNEAVYVNGTDSLNLRSAAVVEAGNIIDTVAEGTQLQRIGYTEEWSKVTYNGKECYASSAYLSTKKPVEFEEVSETVYVKVENTVNVRSKAWAESDIIDTLTSDVAVTRTGISKEADEFGSNWSRITYTDANGKTKLGYINSSFLTTEAPIGFTEVNDTVYITNCESLNLRSQPSRASNIVTSLDKDTELQRIGIAMTADAEDIVWSRVMYQGNICYASSGYLAVKEGAKIFTVDGMNITLGDQFTKMSEADAALLGYTALFDSDDLGVAVIKETFASLTAVGLDTNMSLEDYAELLMTLYGITATTETDGNLVYFTFETASAEGNITVVISVYKSADAFWQVQFQTMSSNYAAFKANILTYAKSVTFN